MGAFDNFDPAGARKPIDPTQTSAPPGPNATPNTNVGTGQRTPPPGGAFSNFNPTGAATQQGGGDQTAQGGPEATGSFWSLRGPGWSPTRQGVNDFATVVNANALQPYVKAYERATGAPVNLAQMHADLAAAQARLGAVGSGAAGMTGTLANPANIATLIPRVGPGVAGAIQSGVNSYGEGGDFRTVTKDAIGGGLVGEATLGLAQPKAAGFVADRAMDTGLGMLGGHMAGGHEVIGGGLGALIGMRDLLTRGTGYLGQKVEGALDNPTVRRAMQQLLYSGVGGGQYGGYLPDQW